MLANAQGDFEVLAGRVAGPNQKAPADPCVLYLFEIEDLCLRWAGTVLSGHAKA